MKDQKATTSKMKPHVKAVLSEDIPGKPRIVTMTLTFEYKGKGLRKRLHKIIDKKTTKNAIKALHEADKLLTSANSAR